MASKLTGKQKAFVDAYAQTLNATESARRAGYAGDDNTLAVIGHGNLRNHKIQSAIDELLRGQSLSRDEVLGRLSAHARGDIGDFIDPATLTLDIKKAKEAGITHLIKKIKQTITIVTDKDGEERQTEIFEFELHDPQKALVHLGKAYAMFTDKVAHEGEVTFTWEDMMRRDDS